MTISAMAKTSAFTKSFQTFTFNPVHTPIPETMIQHNSVQRGAICLLNSISSNYYITIDSPFRRKGMSSLFTIHLTPTRPRSYSLQQSAPQRPHSTVASSFGTCRVSLQTRKSSYISRCRESSHAAYF